MQGLTTTLESFRGRVENHENLRHNSWNPTT